jgi:7,8-dihydroneopterin aldolase/epimerase/oxygenase
MKGYIGIHGLKVNCIIGCNKHERIHHQTLLIDVKFECDFTHSAKSDSLYSTVDYEQVADFITKTAHAGKFHVIEAFAIAVATDIMKKFLTIKECHIKVVKPGAIDMADSCFVEYTHVREKSVKKAATKAKPKRK